MNPLAKEISAEVVELIHRYGFDLGGYSSHALVDYWMQQYPALWIRLATIEALYQGRYKAISIEQILNLWRRRTRPVYHFNGEFERMISLRPMLSTISLSSSASSETKPAQPSAKSSPAVQKGGSETTESLTPAKPYPANSDAAQPTAPPSHLDRADTGTSPFSGRRDQEAMQNRFSYGIIESEEIHRTAIAEPAPIDQFTPTLEVSDFYWRLKAVVQAMGAGAAAEVGRRN